MTRPESFAAFLQKTKEYVDQRPDRPKLITINSWNEWVEGSYLIARYEAWLWLLECRKTGNEW